MESTLITIFQLIFKIIIIVIIKEIIESISPIYYYSMQQIKSVLFTFSSLSITFFFIVDMTLSQSYHGKKNALSISWFSENTSNIVKTMSNLKYSDMQWHNLIFLIKIEKVIQTKKDKTMSIINHCY